MKLEARLVGDLPEAMAKEIKVSERAVSTAIGQAGRELKAAWRAQIVGAGLGRKLSRSIRSIRYPPGQVSLDSAAVVWSNAPHIIHAHDTGVLIRKPGGFFLAIPTPEAGLSLRGGRITPQEWERRNGIRLDLVYRRNSLSILVAHKLRINNRGRAVKSRSKTGRNQVTAIIFFLVPQVKIDKRLDLARDTGRVASGIPRAIVRNWTSGR